MASRFFNTIQEYPPLGTNPVNHKRDARKNLSSSNPPQSTAKTSFSRSRQRVNGPQQGKPSRSGYGNKLNIQREGTRQVQYDMMNPIQTPRDETPEENDRLFLEWTVSAYKEILRDNCHLLKVSAISRPPVMTEFDEGVPHDDNDKKMNIMTDWNTEYQHAQKVLNVCRHQLRLWLMKQYVIQNSNKKDVIRRYNLNFENFKTISTQKKDPVMNPAKWFTKKPGEQSSRMYTPIESYIMKIYSEEREFMKNVIQKFVELVEGKLHEENNLDETEKLGLIEFEFEFHDVQAWTSLYNDMKNKDKNKQNEDKNKLSWPKLPPVCYFAYSNNPEKQTKSVGGKVQLSEEFKAENQKVYEMFKKFQDENNILYDNKTVKRQNELSLRIWFHARAWNAFRKAIQSNLIKQEDIDEYMKKNKIQSGENKYLVLGSTMAFALPAASRASYLVSFERS